MQSLSTKHPIQQWLFNALRVRTANIPHLSNLENALQQFPYMSEGIESIEPFIRSPWWTLRAKTRVDNTKDIAKDFHDRTQEMPDDTIATIYTDGSGINKKIGAAAFNQTDEEVSHHHLGGEMQFNVYTAEITVMQLILEIVWNHQATSSCHVYTDSQTAIKAIK
jgi:hypothetical protein